MPRPHAAESSELASIVERTRELWRDASAGAPSFRVELYAKLAERVRVERGPSIDDCAFRRAAEAGLAIRTLTSLEDGAGFAAASGFGRDVARWVLDHALRSGSSVSGMSPDTVGSAPEDRWDVDPTESLPAREELVAMLAVHPSLEWLEAGTTTEVLVGPGGWVAVRRRQRVWGLVKIGSPRLVARRHLDDWQGILGGDDLESVRSNAPGGAGRGTIIFQPEAAAPIVLALAGEACLSESPADARGGEGWTLSDDPVRKDGLAGGAFDDAGFTAERRSLAVKGVYSGRIAGPGTLWRRSFRDPPAPAPSNLIMPEGAAMAGDSPEGIADRTRVIRISPEVWVLEIELASVSGQPRRRGYARLSPDELLERCTARIGPPRVTAEGPVVPSLQFDGLFAILTC